MAGKLLQLLLQHQAGPLSEGYKEVEVGVAALGRQAHAREMLRCCVALSARWQLEDSMLHKQVGL